jgi:ATP-dependent Clp protease ATP-binding subunit ClpB
MFKPLTFDEIKKIIDIQLGVLKARLAAQEIGLELDDHAKNHLAGDGYDPVYGARPLKRVIQKALQDPLAEKLLAGATQLTRMPIGTNSLSRMRNVPP